MARQHVQRPFLSCLLGSERLHQGKLQPCCFLSCLLGSERIGPDQPGRALLSELPTQDRCITSPIIRPKQESC